MANKSKYARWGIALGAALGALFGVLAGNIGIWLSLGVAIGLVMCAWFRRNATECPQCTQIHRMHSLRREV